MIGLLKKQLDPTCRELAESHEIVQWFEEGHLDAEIAITDTKAQTSRVQLREENENLDRKTLLSVRSCNVLQTSYHVQ